MEKFIKFFNKKVRKLNKYDLIIFFIIIVLFGILSLINLGNRKSPNTFYRFEDKDVIIDLKQVVEINKVKLYFGERASNYKMYISDDNINYIYLTSFINGGAFSWDINDIDMKKTRYIKISFEDKTTLGEIGISRGNKLYKDTFISIDKRKIDVLNDEQNLVPDRKSYKNSSYFDEIYFARTAYEYVHGLKIYEWTHPPLGKILQAIPIYITKNMSPFNYRLMGCLTGVILIGVMYFFGVILFKKRKYGIFAALIMALDTFRYAHTRMGTVDSYLVLFITLSLLFMYLFTEKSKLKFLILSGIFFGLSICIKWTAFYSGIALAIIYFYNLITNKKMNFDHIIYGTIFFVFIPLIIYCSVFFIFSNNYYKTDNFKNIVKINKKMYDYHSKLEATHFFSSKWYTWPISYKPVWYFQEYTYDNKQESISGVGNIIIWYVSIIGVVYSLIKFIVRRDKRSFYLLICIFSMWIPFVFIKRIMYLYHFFPVLPFYFMAAVNMFEDLREKYNLKYIMPIFIIVSAWYFILYYPVISGTEIDRNYTEKIELFKTWYF